MWRWVDEFKPMLTYRAAYVRMRYLLYIMYLARCQSMFIPHEMQKFLSSSLRTYIATNLSSTAVGMRHVLS